MTGQHPASEPAVRRSRRGVIGRLGSAAFATVVTVATVIAVAAVTVGIVHAVIPSGNTAGKTPHGPGGQVVIRLPARPLSYLGAYAKGVPGSYAPLDSFAALTGVRPNIALYYSGWGEPFQSGFATQAWHHQAVPLIQIEPGKTSLQAIADGGYDTYLDSFARAVARFGRLTKQAVIIGFAHEPNGTWYPWGAGHVSPAAWVAAWRHVVTVFRKQGARNVTWLWTVNIVDTKHGIASPGPWWPGSRYVTWVGIDGYYYKPSWSFAPLFGPAIKAVRALTRDPILISETGAAPAAGKAQKIADLFAGVRSYGLLGVVWFDVNRVRDWRIDTPSAIAAYRAAASEFSRPSL
jgi:mannan endo-1,4-beta-mannosidase